MPRAQSHDAPVHVPRRARAAAVGVLAAVLLAGCGGDDDTSDPGSEHQASPNGAGQGAEDTPQIWPLTGLTAPEGESVEREHPVVVAKIDNSGREPQAGLGAADLVVEELVEGGLTRLAAFYYSELPTQVGPVRSMRASDIGIVAPVDGDIATSGAAPVTRRRIGAAGLDFVGEGAKGFRRDPGRSAPYNLMVDLAAVAAARRQEAARPADYLTWGAEDTTIGGQRVESFDVSFSFARTSSWAWTGKDYRLENGFAPAGDVFRPATVLVLQVRTVDAGYRDPAGNPVPETVLDGEGKMMLFHDGKMLRGSWRKAGLDAPLALSTRAGEVPVPPGRVWIELVPRRTGEVKLG